MFLTFYSSPERRLACRRVGVSQLVKRSSTMEKGPGRESSGRGGRSDKDGRGENYARNGRDRKGGGMVRMGGRAPERNKKCSNRRVKGVESIV